jgi:UPF0271 protein
MEINADAGESFGRWELGNEEALFPHLDAVNIACGFHAGDATTMRKTVDLALEHNVSVGAHPGYQDLLGFGRRVIPMAHENIVDMVLYQVGALDAIVRRRGTTLRHVKPHGALYHTFANNAELSALLGDALCNAFPGVPVYLAPGPGLDALAQAGCTVIPENAVDLEFNTQGNNVIDPVPQPKDPQIVAAQALRIAEGTVLTNENTIIPMHIKSMCVHGDRANAPEIAAAVRAALLEAGVNVGPLHP